MIKSHGICYLLLAGTILSTSATAAVFEPTLDALKAQGSVLSGDYALTQVDTDLPAGAVEVTIDNVKYYFIPQGSDASLLTILAGTSAGQLIADANGIFDLNDVKYNFDIAAIPDSVFKYAQGTESDYNFIINQADAEGNLTPQYYKVILKPETFSTSSSIEWSDTALTGGQTNDSVEVTLPNNQTQTFYYQYTKPENYTEANTRIDDTLASANVTNVLFMGLNASYGGAIYNKQNLPDVDISADFIGNYASSSSSFAQGGAIHNRGGTIGDITGDFIGNYTSGYSANGGAIYNYGTNATIGNITGDFIDNYTSAPSAERI